MSRDCLRCGTDVYVNGQCPKCGGLEEDRTLPPVKNIMPAPKMKPPKVKVTVQQLGDVTPTFEGVECGRFHAKLMISAQLLPMLLAGKLAPHVRADMLGGADGFAEAKVVHVEHNHTTDLLEITLEHPEFQVVPDGLAAPELLDHVVFAIVDDVYLKEKHEAYMSKEKDE